MRGVSTRVVGSLRALDRHRDLDCDLRCVGGIHWRVDRRSYLTDIGLFQAPLFQMAIIIHVKAMSAIAHMTQKMVLVAVVS